MINPPQVLPEEPTAVTPHGGFCGGKSQQWLRYPTKPQVRICEGGGERSPSLLDHRFRFDLGHSDLKSATPEGWRSLDRWAVPGSLLVEGTMSGGTDASRESVDATRTRDPAPQARVRRDRPSDCPIAGDCAQHGGRDPRSPCRGGASLAAAGDAE